MVKTNDFAPRLLANIQQLTPSQLFCVALSGGLDSLVLLRTLVALSKQQCGWRIRAIHVNHHLHSDADQWQQFCQNVCDELAVELMTQSITLDIHNGQSIEAQAREKRYAVLQQQLQPNEVLLTAQHQDDQAETFLLQLMRGAGIKGLSAMPWVKPLGEGYLVRPMLDFTREEIQYYAQQQNWHWCIDPSNDNSRFERNYLRWHVLPELKKRWPSLTTVLARSASHCATAQTLLEEYLQADLITCVDVQNKLDCQKLIKFSVPRQLALLRYWLAQQQFALPSTKQLAQLYQSLVLSREDAAPKFNYDTVIIRRFKNKLFANQTEAVSMVDQSEILQKAHQQGLPKDLNRDKLSIRFYQGGEKLYLPGRTFRHRLKKCWQQWQVPSWQRKTIPLIYYNDELIMVLDYVYSKERLCQLCS